MSRLTQRRMRHASLTLAVLLLLLVAMLPGATWPSSYRSPEEAAIEPYVPPPSDDAERERKPFDGIELSRVGPPSMFERDPFALDRPDEVLIPGNWTLASIHDAHAGGWPDTPGWAFAPSAYPAPEWWIPPSYYRGNPEPDTSPTPAGGAGIQPPPGGGLGGGGDGSNDNDEYGQPPIIVPVPPAAIPEPAGLSVLLAAFGAVIRPGRRPRAASTSPACHAT